MTQVLAPLVRVWREDGSSFWSDALIEFNTAHLPGGTLLTDLTPCYPEQSFIDFLTDALGEYVHVEFWTTVLGPAARPKGYRRSSFNGTITTSKPGDYLSGHRPAVTLRRDGTRCDRTDRKVTKSLPQYTHGLALLA